VDLNLFQDMDSQESDGLVLAVELVLSTVIFAGLGWLLDGAIGTRPVFTVFLGAFTLAYEVWKIVTGYDARMAEHQARRVPLRRGPRT
jgi:F0F1-type ATP synthase assembly protein I